LHGHLTRQSKFESLLSNLTFGVLIIVRKGSTAFLLSKYGQVHAAQSQPGREFPFADTGTSKIDVHDIVF
jgi:hypothetical protein